jgi:glycosyltransferase involved in cell wall biosynthesis
LKIAWYSNAPDTPTGYGTQTAQVVRRLAADGHDVHVLANYGHQSARPRLWEGVTVWPQGVVQYGLDVLDDEAEMAEAEVAITLYDVWVMGQAFDRWLAKDARRKVLSWTPIDHFPPPPDVIRWARAHPTIPMSDFGDRLLRAAGVEPVATIPHAVEPVYHPTPSDARKRMGVPEDAFLVGIFAANIGVTPPRKNWAGMLEAVARLMARHDDAWLYLHTDLARPGGLPLPVLITACGMFGMDTGRISVVPPSIYRLGLVDDEEMARLYSAMDVHLLASKGEGFGIPVIEAMACGVPSIVSDFSAQPELVGDTGWTVSGQFDWDHYQGAFFFTPFTFAIEEALEAAYRSRGQRRDACVERARLYDADTVYAERWRPLLASLAKPERKGMGNAARRRKARVAA